MVNKKLYFEAYRKESTHLSQIEFCITIFYISEIQVTFVMRGGSDIHCFCNWQKAMNMKAISKCAGKIQTSLGSSEYKMYLYSIIFEINVLIICVWFEI